MIHFETNERNGDAGNALNALLTALPKVSLHDHLDGSLRPQTVIELSEAEGITTPRSSPHELTTWFLQQSTTGSLVDYLHSFSVTTAVLHRPENLARVAHEYTMDLVADGVIYGEVRWAPELMVTDTMSLDEAVEAVQAGLDSGVRQAQDEGRPVMMAQILCAMRQGVHAMDIAQLALRHRDRGVAGFDIAGPEKGFPPSAHRAAFDLLADHYMPVTVHAGEADDLSSIRSALLDGRAMRLGHGVRLALDIRAAAAGNTLGPLAIWVRDREIPLELSPVSNMHTGAFAHWGTTLGHHPFDTLYRSGLSVTVNTDNRLMSDTTLTKNLSGLVDAFGYAWDDLKAFQLNAARGAFQPLHVRQALTRKIDNWFRAQRFVS